MRKLCIFASTIVVLLFAAVTVFAAAHNSVPAHIATLVENGVVCPNVDTTRNNWGNASRYLDNGSFRISGLGVAGQCIVSTQGILDAVCRVGQVNTTRNNWGNASSFQANGNLRISGQGIAGQCIIPAGDVADAIWSIIPKNNR